MTEPIQVHALRGNHLYVLTVRDGHASINANGSRLWSGPATRLLDCGAAPREALDELCREYALALALKSARSFITIDYADTDSDPDWAEDDDVFAPLRAVVGG
jgi:hypothetical protein